MNNQAIFSYLFLFLTIYSVQQLSHSLEEGFCKRTDDGIQCDRENFALTRLTSQQVGEVKSITIDGNRQLKMKTVNLKPLVFEIDDFLTEEECSHFITVANEIGMKPSYTEKPPDAQVKLMDLNSDQKLDYTEMKLTLENGYDLYLEDEDLLQMYTTLGLDTNNDKLLSKEEMNTVKPRDLEAYIKTLLSEHPEKHSRYSRQAWLYPDKSTDEVFKKVQQRVSQVVELPIELIRLSDFQVVNYGVDGHYNAHLDSTHVKKDMPCCDKGKQRRCRICRYMTVLFYLNDVEEGGETAFPYANVETINHTASHIDRLYHLYKNCEDANFRVSARKGRALIWYNHFLSEADGWMGELDEFTLHGGCPVKQGEKWIANFWIKTTDDKEKDLEKMGKMYL